MIRRFLLAPLVGGCLFAQNLVRIPGGAFEVSDQITTVKVQVSVNEFLLGATEVTQEAYEAITGLNPSFYKGPSHPVENVTWWDAIRYGRTGPPYDRQFQHL